MEHREAERQNVAIRYMDGDLTTSEREDFELHYFECARCADRVRTIIQAGSIDPAAAPGEASSRRVAQPPASSGWLDAFWSWRPGMAAVLTTACVALVFTSYEALRARARLAPQPVTAYHLLPDARGAERSIDRARSGGFVVLTADLPETVRDWRWQIRSVDDGGLTLEGVAVAPPGGTLSLLAPVSRLTPGRYVLSLRDVNLVVPEITYSFRML